MTWKTNCPYIDIPVKIFPYALADEIVGFVWAILEKVWTDNYQTKLFCKSLKHLLGAITASDVPNFYNF